MFCSGAYSCESDEWQKQKGMQVSYVDRVTFDTLVDGLKPALVNYYSERLHKIPADKKDNFLEVFTNKYHLISKKKDPYVVCAECVFNALNDALGCV